MSNDLSAQIRLGVRDETGGAFANVQRGISGLTDELNRAKGAQSGLGDALASLSSRASVDDASKALGVMGKTAGLTDAELRKLEARLLSGLAADSAAQSLGKIAKTAGLTDIEVLKLERSMGLAGRSLSTPAMAEASKALATVARASGMTSADLAKLEARMRSGLSADTAVKALDRVAKAAGLTSVEIKKLERDMRLPTALRGENRLPAQQARLSDAGGGLGALGGLGSVARLAGGGLPMMGVGLGVATVAATKEAAQDALGRYADMERAIVDVQRVSSRSYEQILADMRKLPPELGSVTELTKGYYEVLSAGVTDPVKAQETLEVAAKASKVAQVEQGQTVTALTKLMTAYGGELKSAAEASDLLFQIEAQGQAKFSDLVPVIGETAAMAHNLGVSAKEMGGALSQASMTAGSTAQAATQLNAIYTQLLKPSEEMQRLFDSIAKRHQEVASATGEGLVKAFGFAGALEKINEAAGGSKEAIARAFGDKEAISGYLALAAGGFRDLRTQMDGMANMAGQTEAAFERTAGTIKERTEAAMNSLGRSMDVVSSTFAPALVASLELVARAARDVSNDLELIKHFASGRIGFGDVVFLGGGKEKDDFLKSLDTAESLQKRITTLQGKINPLTSPYERKEIEATIGGLRTKLEARHKQDLADQAKAAEEKRRAQEKDAAAEAKSAEQRQIADQNYSDLIRSRTQALTDSRAEQYRRDRDNWIAEAERKYKAGEISEGKLQEAKAAYEADYAKKMGKLTKEEADQAKTAANQAKSEASERITAYASLENAVQRVHDGLGEARVAAKELDASLTGDQLGADLARNALQMEKSVAGLRKELRDLDKQADELRNKGLLTPDKQNDIDQARQEILARERLAEEERRKRDQLATRNDYLDRIGWMSQEAQTMASLTGQDEFDARRTTAWEKMESVVTTNQGRPDKINGALRVYDAEMLRIAQDQTKELAAQRGEYASLEGDVQGLYQARLDQLEVEKQLAGSAEARAVAEARIAEAKARKDLDVGVLADLGAEREAAALHDHLADQYGRLLPNSVDVFADSFGSMTDAIFEGEDAAKAFLETFSKGLLQVIEDISMTILKMEALKSLGYGEGAGASGGWTGGLASIAGSLVGSLFGGGLDWSGMSLAANAGYGGAGYDPALGAMVANVPLHHDGGLAGESSLWRSVPAPVFGGAPRYHSGGIAGLAPDEVPAILRRREEVLTQDDPRHRDNLGRGGSAQAPIVVHMHISTPDAQSFRQASGQIQAQAYRAMQAAARRRG